MKLRLVSLQTLNDPTYEAVARLVGHASDLRTIVERLPARAHVYGLQLTRRDRIYCLELNTARWPDGRYYLLDRGYDHWDDRVRLGFTLDELRRLGVVAWGESAAVRTAFYGNALPMASDCFQYNPRRWLPQYAELVARLAEFVAERHARLRGGA